MGSATNRDGLYPRRGPHIEVGLLRGEHQLRAVLEADPPAAVRLELLPAPPDSFDHRVIVASSKTTRNPAAVYAVGPRIVLASYEPCALSVAAPRLRYLRRDADGHPVIDVMLRRTSGGN